MKRTVSLVMITKNAAPLLAQSLESVKGLVDEMIIIDDYSKDKTRDIAQSFGGKIFTRRDDDVGVQRQYGIEKSQSEYILLLDADEILSESLQREIRELLHSEKNLKDIYFAQFQNHFKKKKLLFGGEQYSKLFFFRKGTAKILSSTVHEKAVAEMGSQTGNFKNPILHYSYQSIFDMFRKFSGYALRMAIQKKSRGERSSLKKVFIYPPHMFWSRFFKDKGYKDGLFRLPVDIGFAYMELMMYLYLVLITRKHIQKQ